jgi:hypothetical protein
MKGTLMKIERGKPSVLRSLLVAASLAIVV